ncbi:DEAD-box type RNA helicase [Steccherinum ochraceum]|uniref:DEAD-box type RNA helicase n=1 Tax=Steccherinum ochraceum TaxID=92696 RepID=A0A4R0RRZ1_9APHY|nr:DEAD-box type RNA helicase [Steccherinum ochraceum]
MPSDNREARIKLNHLRDAPAATENAQADVLALIYDVLIKDGQPPRPHWFCSRADQLIVDAATFLLRLHAYNSPRVDAWRLHLKSCLLGCMDCVGALQEAKVSSRHTYFGAFKDVVLAKFWDSFSEWEARLAIEACKTARIDPSVPAGSRRTLNEAPPAVTYLMLSNTQVLQNLEVMRLLQECTPTHAFSDWPTAVPPPGLLLLLVHNNTAIRTWTRSQLGTFTTTPMKSEQLLPAYTETLERVTKVIGLFDAQLGRAAHSSVSGDSFPFAQDPSQLWSGYGNLLRFIPPECFRPSEMFRLDLRHIVIGHLSDPGSHFLDVLRCFLLILNRIGPEVWQEEGKDYPLVVFNTIKDNPSYIECLRTSPVTDRDPWTLVCLSTYLKSLDRLPAFKEVLPAMMLFLCEELQHERFKDIQPSAIGMAAKVLVTAMTTAPEDSAMDLSSVWESLDIHTTRFVAVAFGKLFTSDPWKNARKEARKLVQTTLAVDIKGVASAISHLSNPAKHTNPIVTPGARVQLWKKMYEQLHHTDPDGVALVFHALSEISHVDTLTDAAFQDVIKQSAHPSAAQKAFTAINNALKVFRDGFAEAISRILDFSSQTAVGQLIRKDMVTQDIMALMFSPIEDIREAAQSVAGLALDVETRPECFRALLKAVPDQAFDGINIFLATFDTFARTVPEACSLSKSLALCFTDIIDVMCSSPEGLLFKQSFVTSIPSPGAAVVLPKWWSAMTKALSIIFLRTPRWALYFDNHVMVEWMRDALIFGRDLLAQRKVIETAAIGPDNTSAAKRKLSHIGKKMVDDLQQVLQDLTRWLRLTDEELLFQSFALLQSLLSCFRETQITPLEGTLQKLQKHVDDARKKDPSRPQTRLDAPRLARLQETLSSFEEEEEDEDEIQIISHTKAPAKLPAATKTKQEVLKPKAEKSIKSRAPEVTQIRPVPTKKSSKFTAEDQRKLSAASSLPKFSKTVKSSPPVASSSTSSVVAKSVAAARSSSSESESEDEEGGTLASLVKLQRTPTIKKPAERRQVKMMDLPTKNKNSALDRINRRDDARRTGLRLKPDISSLHRTVLSWDYNHTGSSPPASGRLEPVPDTFHGPDHYRRVFEPLLLSECWSQIQQSKDEPQDKYPCLVVGRQYTDDWSDLECTIADSVKQDWYLTDADVVLLTMLEAGKSHLAKVQSYKAGAHGIQLSLRLWLSGQDPGPQVNATWTLYKVVSLTTLHREYAALLGLPYYDLFDFIMRPDLAQPSRISSDELERTMSTYKLNEPQAKAILSSMNVEGFSLIQGPPGTGKTSTICGLVQLFLARRPRPATTIHVGRTSGPADREPPKKILLCAPSNAAIDEITNRLKGGVSGAGKKDTAPKVVRVGAPKGMHPSVKDVSLDSLVEQRLNSDSKATVAGNASNEIALLRAKLEDVRSKRSRKLEEISNTHDNLAKVSVLEDEMKILNKQRLTITHELDKLRDKQKSDNRALDAFGRRARFEIMQEADVICSTLAGAGHDLLEAFDFEMVVIDEAAQAIELSSLIPLKYRCHRCIMVGGKPYVLSRTWLALTLNQIQNSYLQRIQYRMHPEISRLPSNLFYDGRLLDGPEMAVRTKKPWHTSSKFGPYRFYNVHRGVEEKGSFHSLVNRSESQIAVALYQRLTQEFSAYDFDHKIGIVTMYRAQVGELRKAFEQRFGFNVASTVDFNTVDGFQGQEKEIIILSCVRAGPGLQNVGFLSDVRRMNVALTRAKSSVFVLGNAATLERSDENWRSIVADARQRSCLVEVSTDVRYFTAPAGPQPTSPAKTIKSAAKPSQDTPAPPANLLTPQQLAANNRSVSGKGREPVAASSSSSSSNAPPPVPPAPPVIPQKRRPDEEDEPPPRPNGDHMRDRPPPKPKVKRQKQASSMFIPKKILLQR